MKLALPAVTMLVFIMASRHGSAGDLNPPAGPIAPTHKTLTAVEPRTPISAATTPGDADSIFKITASGSYYLTGNITGVAAMHGIEIAASGVTVDLMGFELVGTPGSLDGVSVTLASSANIALVNGSIRSWGQIGANLTSTSVHALVENVRASFNGGSGLRVGTGCEVRRCTAGNNASHGIDASAGSTISGCTLFQNTGDGINTNINCTIIGCTTYANSGNGIDTTSGCTITDCTAGFNFTHGIRVDNGSTIAGCTVYASALDGIVASSDCTVRNNASDSNGNVGDGAGIHILGFDNRVEGNNCTDNDRGIDVDNAGNLVIRNSCSGNTNNWDLVANNVVGPILDRTAPASAAISGNSAPDSTGSTHPNANFTY